MIHVEYKKKNNFPHDREIILFDRDAFQSLGDQGLLKVNKIYNVLCPQVFVIECLAPNRASSAEKEQLLRRLKLIENPIVLTGDTYRSPVIDIPHGTHYPSILMSEEIAANCITATPIIMERVASEKLISHYEPRIDVFKNYIKEQTERCEAIKGTLVPKTLIAHVQELAEQNHNRIPSKQEVKKGLRRDERTDVKVDPKYVAKMTLRAIKEESIIDNVCWLARAGWLPLTDKETRILHSQIQDGKTLTIENYPSLAYPIYIYYLFRYIVHGSQYNTAHLDQSYVRDFRYLHYLNFCNIFVANEKSTPHIVNSLPYSNIKETRITTSYELKSELQI